MKFIKNWFTNNKFPLLAFLIWRLVLGVLAWLAAHFNLHLHPQFPYYLAELANRYPRSLSTFAFFDGIHYLRIARYGYLDTGTQAFFPLFPLTIRFFHNLTNLSYLNSALLLTSFFSLLTIIVIYYTFNKQTAKKIILLLLVFPTSFFFASVYTESLFLLLFSLWIYLVKKYNNSHNTSYMLLATVVSATASATRITGLALSLATTYLIWFPPLRLEAKGKRQEAKILVQNFLLTVISFSGFLAYALYLYLKFHDPLMFLHVQAMFGANRSTHPIIPLQTLWRYFKILITATPTTFLYWRALAELLTFLWGLYLLYKLLKAKGKRLKAYYALTSVIMLSLSSFTGSLSSMPRYFLVILPLFYIWAKLYRSRLTFYLTLIFLDFLQLIAFYLFLTGQFIA